PQSKAIQLTPMEAAVIQACDGERVAKEIAEQLMNDPLIECECEEDVYAILDRLVASGLISWQFEVPWTLCPPFGWHIDTNFFRQLEQIRDVATRNRAS